MRKPNLGILVKPASYDCNMACDYCYYRPVSRLYPNADRPRMSLETVDAVCTQYGALGPVELKLGWQGGEPTLMGLDFFQEVVSIQHKHARAGEHFANSLQTNGVALNDDWCSFLAANNFLVGLSMDGPADVNAMRRFPNGHPAFDTAMRALRLLKKHNVEFNILTVVSKANAAHPRRVFQFLVENDLHYAQLIPCTEPGERPGDVSQHSVTAEQYADFMAQFFEAWVDNDDPTYYERRIDNWLHQFFGLAPECCEYRGDCSNLLTVEWNGDVYPCDFFVEEMHRLGNVHEQTLQQMLSGPAFRSFVRHAKSLPTPCKACEWLSFCHGGCYRHRRRLGIQQEDPPYLCAATKRIFAHVFSRLRELKDGPLKPRLHEFLNQTERRVATGLLHRPKPAKGGQPSRPPASRRHAAPGRNDPCPCGSGRKLKHCCGRVARALPRR